jgi:DNA-binding CsgD family transcriptional regulator
LGVSAYTAYAELARGMLALSNGDNEVAVAWFQAVDHFASEAAIVDTPMLWWSSDLIEACVRHGMTEAAEQALHRFERALASRQTPTGFAVAARCRALLDPDAFQRHLAQALAWHDRSSMPFERARTELTLGRYLRRSHCPKDAREHLQAALDVFTRLGAVRWSEWCRAELEATGVRLPRPKQALSVLTPQELQVALHVAEGMPNREVAARLFLSVKTVEFHLRNVFQKLGINRRTELAILVAKQNLEAGPGRTGRMAEPHSS